MIHFETITYADGNPYSIHFSDKAEASETSIDTRICDWLTYSHELKLRKGGDKELSTDFLNWVFSILLQNKNLVRLDLCENLVKKAPIKELVELTKKNQAAADEVEAQKRKAFFKEQEEREAQELKASLNKSQPLQEETECCGCGAYVVNYLRKSFQRSPTPQSPNKLKMQ